MARSDTKFKGALIFSKQMQGFRLAAFLIHLDISASICHLKLPFIKRELHVCLCESHDVLKYTGMKLFWNFQRSKIESVSKGYLDGTQNSGPSTSQGDII